MKYPVIIFASGLVMIASVYLSYEYASAGISLILGIIGFIYGLYGDVK